MISYAILAQTLSLHSPLHSTRAYAQLIIMKILPVSLSLAAAGILSSLAPAQFGAANEGGGRSQRIQQLFGQAAIHHMGPIRPCGDIDLDGIEDYVSLRGIQDSYFSGERAGRIFYIYSGAAGAPIRTHTGLAWYGYEVAPTGDLNGDGISEYAAGAPGSSAIKLRGGVIHLYDGASGSLIRDLPPAANWGKLGVSLLGGYDFDGDGIGDLVATDAHDFRSPGAKRAPLYANRLKIWSGADAISAATWSPYINHSLVGNRAFTRLRGIHDLDGDGADELMVWFEDGTAKIMKGQDLSTLWDAPVGTLNASELEDLDGDGVTDFVIRQSSGGQRLAVYSGATQTQLYTISGSSIGDQIANMGDVDGDGAGDIAASNSELVQIWSGADGRRLSSYEGFDVKDGGFGRALNAVDVNGDGRKELMLGTIDHHRPGLNWCGALSVIDFDPMMWVSANEISDSAPAPITFNLDFAGSGLAYVILASAKGMQPTMVRKVSLPLERDALTTLMINSPPAWFVGAHGVADSAGIASATFAPPAGSLSSLVGQTIYFSAIGSGGSLGPGPHWTTVAHSVRVQP